jgi:hypothetical protein
MTAAAVFLYDWGEGGWRCSKQNWFGRREADVGRGRNTQMLVFWYINLRYSYDCVLICG